MLPVGFDESVLRVTEGLNREGSGIITEIDVKATLILGACHSALAYEALQIRGQGRNHAALQCRCAELAPGRVEVAAVDPGPGADKEANWLPAPEGPFGMILRPTFPRPEHWSGPRRRCSGCNKPSANTWTGG